MVKRPKALFVLSHPWFLQSLGGTAESLGSRGALAQVICIGERKNDIALATFAAPIAGKAGVAFASPAGPGGRRDAALKYLCEHLRVVRDAIHYSRAEFRAAAFLRQRFVRAQRPLSRMAERQAPRRPGVPRRLFGFAERVLTQGYAGVLRAGFALLPDAAKLRLSDRLARLDGAIASDRPECRRLAKLQPDIVVATPLVGFGAGEADYIKAAHRLGIPTLLAVASWDNLSSKGVVKVRPDHVAVWNEAMRQEAIALQGFRPDQVHVVGAAVFDWWFGQQPSTTREAFAQRHGLDPEGPLIVYGCSSRAIAGDDECALVLDWAARLRRHEDALLRHASLLVRPHPLAMTSWTSLGPERLRQLSALGVCVSADAAPPVGAAARADFFDTLYHADALVGLNTSAMVEASILARPVFTFTDHDAGHSQAGNLHFGYLRDSGFVCVGSSVDDHLGQLAAALRDRPDVTAACAAFVDRFIRPRGRELPVAAILGDLVQELAAPGAAPRLAKGAARASQERPPAMQLRRPAVRAPAGDSKPVVPGEAGL